MRRFAHAVGVLIGCCIALSSCSTSGGIAVSSPSLSSYRTEPGTGILCGQPGDYDYFTFAINKGGIVEGQIVETSLSPLAALPMGGSLRGETVSLFPPNGDGAFSATLRNHTLTFSENPGMSNPFPLSCSLTTDAKWRAIADHTKPFNSRPLNTSEFEAMSDLVHAVGRASAASESNGPYATPASTLVEEMTGSESQQVPAKYSAARSTSQPHLTFTAGPVIVPNSVSVAVTPGGYVLTLATRASDGSCWYNVTGAGVSSTPPGAVEPSCSATDVPEKTVKYDGP